VTNPAEQEPIRILQIYDPEKQKQFAHFTVQDRLEWLEAINQLYWQARLGRESSSPATPANDVLHDRPKP
jgi:hypothetical protein